VTATCPTQQYFFSVNIDTSTMLAEVIKNSREPYRGTMTLLSSVSDPDPDPGLKGAKMKRKKPHLKDR
jgi:hypothetical protein